MGKSRLLGEYQVEVWDAKPSWNLVPEDSEFTVSSVLVRRYDHLANPRHHVVCGQGDVYNTIALNPPVRDLPVNIGDAVVFHDDILSLGNPAGPVQTIYKPLE